MTNWVLIVDECWTRVSPELWLQFGSFGHKVLPCRITGLQRTQEDNNDDIKKKKHNNNMASVWTTRGLQRCWAWSYNNMYFIPYKPAELRDLKKRKHSSVGCSLNTQVHLLLSWNSFKAKQCFLFFDLRTGNPQFPLSRRSLLLYLRHPTTAADAIDRI